MARVKKKAKVKAKTKPKTKAKVKPKKKKILCMSCGDPIHPKRLKILPNTKQCVNCSDVGRKAGITVTKGTGDHTYNETIIIDQEDYLKIQEMELKLFGKRKDDIDHPDLAEDEEDITPDIE